MSSSVEQWEQYYRTGAFATGPVGVDGSYDLEVKSLWLEFFSAMPSNARVLDIGTGNGVVASIALEASRQSQLNLEVHGSDLAQIQPMQDVPNAASRLQGAIFHPGVSTEKLPMADASFDAVSAHYAFEYSKAEPALRQIHRVLKPGGRALFVLHHHASVLANNARETIHEGNYVVNEAKLYAKLRALLGYQGDSQEVALQRSEPLRNAIRDVKALFQQVAPRGSGQMLGVALDAVQKLMRMHGQLPTRDLVAEIDRAEQELQDAIQRVRDLLNVAQSDEDMARLQKLSQGLGFDSEGALLLHHNKTNLLGWTLALRKRLTGLAVL